MDYNEASLKLHAEKKGKFAVVSKVPIKTRDDLSTAYTPGVAAPCLAIAKDKKLSYTYTSRGNIVAVISDGSAVLGLGNIGPEAGMPVMEGKAVLFKEFADIDAIPIVLATQDTEEIIKTVAAIAPSFGGINLEDISAPRCFEIERRLKEMLDIPVMHDDQHGTAVVVLAALQNALKVVKKEIKNVRIIISGAGAAGVAIAKLLLTLQPGDIILLDSKGAIHKGRNDLDGMKRELVQVTNKHGCKTLDDSFKGADVFIGVSKPGSITEEHVKSMASGAIVFAMANPTPEITPDIAKRAGVAVMATGRSDYPNQINNVLAFPGIFKGALSVRATAINEQMKVAAAHALAALVPHPTAEMIIPAPLDKTVVPALAQAVAEAARKSGVARI